MTTDWLLRVGDGKNFMNSAKYGIWGISSGTFLGNSFLKRVKPGDRLWFVKNKSQGEIIAVAVYCSQNSRVFGPLISTMTNVELGWTGEGPKWTSDTEIHYSDLYNLEGCGIVSHITGAASIRKYNHKCSVDLNREYENIMLLCGPY